MDNKYKVKPYGHCPVQADGELTDGNHYYFRSRVSTSFVVHPVLYIEAFDKPLFERHLETDELFHEESIELCNKWIDEYYNREDK